VGSLAGLWRPVLEPALDTVDDLVVDLRSGTYAHLARLPNAVAVHVVTATGTTVSHFNKAQKGRLARVLATARTEPGTVTGLVRVARNAGLDVRRTGDNTLDLRAD
ncbi:MAG TPA: peroxide stress protein YaaA, partial [Pseudonocardiaceae bacterium]